MHTPDYYGGAVFDDLDDGMKYLTKMGFEEAHRRGDELVAALAPDLVYAGFSMGASIAERLTLTRPGARAAVLLHNAEPVSDFEQATWPNAVPVQLHYASQDPWVNAGDVAGLKSDVERAGETLEAYSYPGGGHLFTDPGLSEYDPKSAELLWERVLEFLERLQG